MPRPKIVNEPMLKQIMYTHRNVNVKADGKVLKYRYRHSYEKGHGRWLCNGEESFDTTKEVIDDLFSKHTEIQVTWKKQFERF